MADFLKILRLSRQESGRYEKIIMIKKLKNYFLEKLWF